MTGLLTPGEVAGQFGVTIPTVWAWVRQGRIRATRTPGNRLRFTHEAVQAARDRGPDGDTDSRDEGQGAPHPLPAPAPPPRSIVAAGGYCRPV